MTNVWRLAFGVVLVLVKGVWSGVGNIGRCAVFCPDGPCAFAAKRQRPTIRSGLKRGSPSTKLTHAAPPTRGRVRERKERQIATEAEEVVGAVPGDEVEVHGVDSPAADFHAVAVAVAFLAGSVPWRLATQPASNEKPGLRSRLPGTGMQPATRPVSAMALAPGSVTLLRKAMPPVKRMLAVKPTALAWKRPIVKRSPKAKEMPSAKAHLLLSIRHKGRIQGHRRRQWLS
jgi:hypothetical protein